MSKGPGPLSLLPLTLANAIQRLGGKGKRKLVGDAPRIKPTKAVQAACSYCRPGQSCKHCRNFNKIAKRWAAGRDRKAQRRAERQAVPA
jgi:hypothetical protein